MKLKNPKELRCTKCNKLISISDINDIKTYKSDGKLSLIIKGIHIDNINFYCCDCEEVIDG